MTGGLDAGLLLILFVLAAAVAAGAFWIAARSRGSRRVEATLARPNPRNADTLRGLGRELEAAQAQSATILRTSPGSMEITWWDDQGVETNRTYTDADLRTLVQQGRNRRGQAPPRAEEGLEELLRTLGQELDRKGVNLMAVTAQARRFNVNGTVDEESFFCFYARDELHQLSRARRAERRSS